MYRVNKELIETSKRIRDKYMTLKRGEVDFQEMQADRYQPIIEQIQQLKQTATPPPPTLPKDAEDEVVEVKKFLPPETVLGPTAVRYLYTYFSKPNQVDRTHGIYTDNGKFKIGNSFIHIVNLNDLEIDGVVYEGTKGLWQLLTLKSPKKYSDNDLHNYTEIVKSTYAHRQNYKPDGNPLSTSSSKYKHFIKPIIDEERVGGSGLKVYNTRPVEYVYWNDINELVDRLKLLYASKEAGNTSVDNEIESILEELTEEGIIKNE